MAKKGKRKVAVAFSLSMEPELISGALCASKSEASDANDSPLRVYAETATLNHFFPDAIKDVYGAAGGLKDLNPACKKVLKEKKVTEESIRDAVFNELLRRDVKFPPLSQWWENPNPNKISSKNEKTEKKAYFHKKNQTNKLNPSAKLPEGVSFFYHETNLSVLLGDCSMFFIPNEEGKISSTDRMDRLMNGFLVTTTSLPDMVPFQKCGDGDLYMIRMGEFKNKSKYTKGSATTQCFAYLYELLYWIRVVYGIPLQSVYGFGFCGEDCGDSDDTYAVGFFKLTAPQHLGQTFRAEAYWEDFGVDDDLGVKLLHLYLTQGKLWDMATAQRFQIESKLRKPAIFAAPKEYWQCADSDISLVRNGTRAIVFKVNYVGLEKILNNVMTGDPGDLPLQTHIRTVLEQVHEKQDHGKEEYYVKIRTYDTSYHFERNCFGDIYGRANSYVHKKNYPKFCADFNRTYIADPVSSGGRLIVIMADRGSKVDRRPKSSEEVRNLMKPLKSCISEMVNIMFHGDFLPHNFLTDKSGRLVVIDHDEGGIDEVSRRIFDYKATNWRPILRYPNALRLNRKEYTEIQFAASLLQLGSDVKEDLQDLRGAAEELGNYLIQYELEIDKRAPMIRGGVLEQAATLIAKVNKEVEKFLKVNSE